MKKPLITVVIPCYNTEKYLSKCIESVLNQTYSNLEILLINDGSTDKSLEIMQKYANENSNIVIINQENHGIAYNRNLGIEKSNGEFMIFVDSDDFVSKYYCEALYNSLERNNADVAMCNVEKIIEGDIVTEKEISAEETAYNREETIYQLISYGDFYDFPVAKLYKKSILKDVRFPLGRIYEDSATMPKVYANIEKAVVLKESYYFYLTQRENSITTSKYVEKNLNDNYLAINDRYVYLSEHVPEMIDIVKSGYIRNILTLFDRVYLLEDKSLINSEIVQKLQLELYQLVENVDKNILFKILNSYKRACLFLFLQSKEIYEKNIKELFESRK